MLIDIDFNIKQDDFYDKLRYARYEYMKSIYSNIPNPFIPDPSLNFYNKTYKYLPILDITTHRLIRLMVLKKYPGVEIECRLCKTVTRSYFKHINDCICINEELYDKFLPLKQLSITDWKNINNKNDLISFFFFLNSKDQLLEEIHPLIYLRIEKRYGYIH